MGSVQEEEDVADEEAALKHLDLCDYITLQPQVNSEGVTLWQAEGTRAHAWDERTGLHSSPLSALDALEGLLKLKHRVGTVRRHDMAYLVVMSSSTGPENVARTAINLSGLSRAIPALHTLMRTFYSMLHTAKPDDLRDMADSIVYFSEQHARNV